MFHIKSTSRLYQGETDWGEGGGGGGIIKVLSREGEGEGMTCLFQTGVLGEQPGQLPAVAVQLQGPQPIRISLTPGWLSVSHPTP